MLLKVAKSLVNLEFERPPQEREGLINEVGVSWVAAFPRRAPYKIYGNFDVNAAFWWIDVSDQAETCYGASNRCTFLVEGSLLEVPTLSLQVDGVCSDLWI